MNDKLAPFTQKVDESAVLNCDAATQTDLAALLLPYGMQIKFVPETAAIPGSFFGEREAGLVGNVLYLRHDTPIHSALHESCHYICMDPARRTALDTDAGGDYNEENGVCYLQILLADKLPHVGRQRMMQDMDSWGYTFRLGSTQAWFEQDAEDAHAWLLRHKIIDENTIVLSNIRN